MRSCAQVSSEGGGFGAWKSTIGGASSGSALAAGLVVGLMLVPTVSSMTDDALVALPADLREASMALGATDGETGVRVLIPAALPGIAGDAEFLSRIERVPAEARTALTRIDGSVTSGKRAANVEVLGVDPRTFERVAFFRDDFAEDDLRAMLRVLQENSATPARGPLLPANARQFGVWIRMSDIRGRVVVGVSLRDAAGRTTNRQLGEARPGDPATSEWTFFSADLQQPRSLGGGLIRDAQAATPLEVRGVFVLPAGAIANQRGTVLFGPALATASAPAVPTNPSLSSSGLDTSREAWRDAVLVQDFTQPGFETIQGTRPVQLTDVVRSGPDAPPGFSAAMRYEWQDAGISPPLRGLRPVVDATPARVFLARSTARQLEVKTGDTVMIGTGSRHLTASVAGLFDYFPTYRPATGRSAGTGLVLVDGGRLGTAINGAIPDQPLGPNEAWFTTTQTAATRNALKALSPLTIMEREAVRAQQQDDPLIAAGWAGILAIAFGAVLLLSAIGFVVYSYLTAQQRALEFAILRTLGFSRPQIFSVVLFEHLFVIAAGMGLGTLVGLRIGRLMLAFLGIDEQGGQVVPPFIQRVSWIEVFVVWGILGTVFVATIAAVVTLYFRLTVSRALRIGDA